MIYASDIDLLYWEPNLGTLAAGAAQTPISGTGTLAGTSFTLDAGSLSAAGVTAGTILVLSGQYAGSYPIVSVNSATALTVSRLGQGLSQDPPVPVPIGNGAVLPYAVRSFWVQRRIVSERLEALAGIAGAAILNPDALVRPTVLGALWMIHGAIWGAADPDGHFAARANLYERLFHRALREVRLELDRDGDGLADEGRATNLLRFERQ